MSADLQEEREPQRRVRRRRERRERVVHPFDIQARPGLRLWRPPRRGGRGGSGRLATWLRGGAELYGPPFYFLLGLAAAAVLAVAYVAVVAPARARERAALREKLERPPAVAEVGFLQEPDPIEVIEETESYYPQIGLPDVRLIEPPPVLGVDGEAVGNVPHPNARRVKLIEEDTLERVDELTP